MLTSSQSRESLSSEILKYYGNAVDLADEENFKISNKKAKKDNKTNIPVIPEFSMSRVPPGQLRACAYCSHDSINSTISFGTYQAESLIRKAEYEQAMNKWNKLRTKGTGRKPYYREANLKLQCHCFQFNSLGQHDGGNCYL